MTPDEALAAIRRIRHAAEDLEGTTPESDEAAELVAEMAAALMDLRAVAGVIDSPEDPDPDWAEVDAAFDDLRAWLGQPAPAAGGQPKAQMTREQRINLAVSIATRGRGASRGRDAADVVLDAFYGGLEATLRTTGRVIAGAARLAGRATLAAGEALGEAIHAGAVHVDAYIRNGKPVRAHERSKAAPGAHLLYR